MGLAGTDQGGPQDTGPERAWKYRGDLAEERTGEEKKTGNERINTQEGHHRAKRQTAQHTNITMEKRCQKNKRKTRDDGRRGNKSESPHWESKQAAKKKTFPSFLSSSLFPIELLAFFSIPPPSSVSEIQSKVNVSQIFLTKKEKSPQTLRPNPTILNSTPSVPFFI